MSRGPPRRSDVDRVTALFLPQLAERRGALLQRSLQERQRMVVEVRLAIDRRLRGQAPRAPVRTDVVCNLPVHGLAQRLTIHRVPGEKVTGTHLVDPPAVVLEVYLFAVLVELVFRKVGHGRRGLAQPVGCSGALQHEGVRGRDGLSAPQGVRGVSDHAL